MNQEALAFLGFFYQNLNIYPTGQTWRAYCPFCNGKDFYVFPERLCWRCFDCQEHGNEQKFRDKSRKHYWAPDDLGPEPPPFE